LPDFGGLLGDIDGFKAAIDGSVATLAPRAGVAGRTRKHRQGQAVLRETLTFFARRGGRDLRDFIDLLSALPDGASTLVGADKTATELAQALTVAVINDDMFAGGGEPMDPGVLLTPVNGKRARISVVSFVGLSSSDEQRQGFVSQLQLELFSWVTRHPAGPRPLGGLLVMDEAQDFAPAGAMKPSTQTNLTLASQARKYGLGLVFATQGPKRLNNGIPGNSATQLFGRLNSPVQIATARELARSKGGDVPDIARLKTGQFYVALEGHRFHKVATPLCLSHHPAKRSHF
jgi:hypothetical protein